MDILSSVDVETEQVSVATQDYEDAGTQCYQTPGYLREARMSIMSTKNKSLRHSLYQSRLAEDDIMEGGTQTTPTVNVESLAGTLGHGSWGKGSGGAGEGSEDGSLHHVGEWR